MKNKLKCGLRQHDLKLVDLIKLWFSLIKQVKSLILELINFGDLIKNIATGIDRKSCWWWLGGSWLRERERECRSEAGYGCLLFQPSGGWAAGLKEMGFFFVLPLNVQNYPLCVCCGDLHLQVKIFVGFQTWSLNFFLFL